ncbi:hypothetical protein ACIBEA_36595 [Streptomyces sp. NPDC051555]|uniref:hypothetical protein n=1 Tax=Streptomyces sp. NPDC051555 TaxID=3365657 RepID=UPI00378D97F0
MTETVTDPQAPPEESTPPPVAALDAGTATVGKQVEQSTGGFPVVPLSLSGTNTAAGLLATAALAGGPVAVAVAMTGAAVLGTAAARHRAQTTKRKNPAKHPAPAAGRTTGTSAGRGLLGQIPSQPRPAARTAGGTGARKTAGGQARHRAAGTSAGGRSGGPAAGSSRVSARERAARAVDAAAGGRAGQVRALRSQARSQSPTRAATRTAATQARRQVADTRRAAKANERAAGAGGNPRGVAARTLGKGIGKAVALRDKAAAAARGARDRSAARTVDAGRQGIRQAARRQRIAAAKAPARQAARRALRRSAARFQARRALAAVLGGALGLLGMVTTPLGRWLGWGWLIHPGRRLYRFFAGRARIEREDQDGSIRAQLDADEEAAEEQVAAAEEEDEVEIGDQAARPATHVPAPPTSQGEPGMSSTDTGFRFEELAAEMEQAAQSYEPESAMEILAMVEGLPEALASIANIMRILAERSDNEFPLDKAVADGFADIFGTLNAATAAAEDLGETFRLVHEPDIARHEDPRNGPEAEKGWNV